MDVREQLRRIAEDLGLAASGSEQDWGIELSDRDRLSEFLDYYEARSAGWSPWVHRAYADLVFESANEALEDGIAVPEGRLRRFAADMAAASPDALAYWTGLTPTDADPWPVQALFTTSRPDRDARGARAGVNRDAPGDVEPVIDLTNEEKP